MTSEQEAINQFESKVLEYAKDHMDVGVISITEVLLHAGIEPDRLGHKIWPTWQAWANRAAKCLVSAGWEAFRVRMGKSVQRRYRLAVPQWKCTYCGASGLTSAEIKLHAKGVHLR